MPIKTTYPEDFERVWKAYPDWPKGRSKKKLSFIKWQALKKEGWTDEDTAELINEIEIRKRRHEYWQRGNRYGPQALQVFLYQRGWEDDYPTVKQKSVRETVVTQEDEAERHMKFLRQMLGYGATIEQLRSQGNYIPPELEHELQARN